MENSKTFRIKKGFKFETSPDIHKFRLKSFWIEKVSYFIFDIKHSIIDKNIQPTLLVLFETFLIKFLYLL